jgi:hypothetical protein
VRAQLSQLEQNRLNAAFCGFLLGPSMLYPSMLGTPPGEAPV